MRPVTHGGDVYRHPDCLDLSANLNPLGMPKAARAALIASVDEFCHYPDPTCAALREALAAAEGVDPHGVVVTAGATDAFERIVRVVSPRCALVLAPTYGGYEEALSRTNCEIVRLQLSARQGFVLGDRIISALAGCDMVFLANPNNPTGLTIEDALLDRVVRAARVQGVTVVLDECFVDLTDKPGSNRLLTPNPHLIIVKALTKTYALAGLRLGYAMTGSAGLAERLREAGPTWAVSVPAEVAGLAALSEEGYLEESRACIRRNRDRLMEILESEGLEVVPGEANFLLFTGPVGLYEELLARKVLVRPCESFMGLGPVFYRIAVKGDEETDAFAEALHEALGALR